MSADEWVVVRLQMQNAHRFMAEARAAGVAVREVGGASRWTGTQFHYLGGRGFWLNQAFFTLRRTIYGLTLGLTGLAGAATVMGFNFNNVMEQSNIAFTQFLGSAQAARKELEFLFNLAALTPFEFPQLLQASRQFLAFGFNVKETNHLLTALADAVAGFGLGSEAIDRATLALGQMLSTGRILGQDLRQLMQLGLFNPADFARRLRLPPDFLKSPGELMIPSKAGIAAIVAYWQSKFGGMAKRFQFTWQGELTTLRDFGGQMFGAMAFPLQMRLEKEILPTVIDIVRRSTATFKATGSMEQTLRVMDEGIGRGIHLANVWIALRKLSEPLVSIFVSLGGAFLYAFRTLEVGTRLAVPVIILLRSLAFALRLIEPILGPLITLWIAERTAHFLITLAIKSRVLWEIILVSWERKKLFWTGKYNTVLKLQTALTWANIRAKRADLFATTGVWNAQKGQYTQGYRNQGMMARLGRSIVGVAGSMSLLSFGVIGAVILIAAALIVLYFKWQWFHNKVNAIVLSVVSFIRRHWRLAVLVLTAGFAEIIFATVFLVQHFGTIVKWLKAMVHWAVRAGNAIGDIWKKIPGHGLIGRATGWAGGLVGLQEGGLITMGGAFRVGERGPENVYLPAGAVVAPTPMAALGAGSAATLPRELVVRSPLYLDGRVVAESVARFRLDRQARS